MSGTEAVEIEFLGKDAANESDGVFFRSLFPAMMRLTEEGLSMHNIDDGV